MAAPLDPRTGTPVVAMVGGGQLSRMTHAAAIALGQSLRVLATEPAESAALVAADVRIGDHRDLAALQALADGATVVTFDHEHVPPSTCAPSRGPVTGSRPARPRWSTRRTSWCCAGPWPTPGSRNRPGPRRRPSHAVAAFAEDVGWPVVLKTPRGGYDGKGVFVVGGPDEVADLLEEHGTLLIEERVAMVRELSAQVARSPFGQVAVWPVVETVQRDGVSPRCWRRRPGWTISSPPRRRSSRSGSPTAWAWSACSPSSCSRPADGVLVNELAMRPHNSGHWTIEGARTSQFEQHLRAVLDYPLGDTAMPRRWR